VLASRNLLNPGKGSRLGDEPVGLVGTKLSEQF